MAMSIKISNKIVMTKDASGAALRGILMKKKNSQDARVTRNTQHKKKVKGGLQVRNLLSVATQLVVTSRFSCWLYQ